jgi:hypothetical protein
MEFSSPEAFLAHVLWTFRPYLNKLVLVGGFAVRLYELHPRAAKATVRALRTFDADLAAGSARIPVEGDTLAKLADAGGLRQELLGGFSPPAMRFFPTAASVEPSGAGQYAIEFLVPLIGAPASRSGKAAQTSDIQDGVTAQRLRYLDLLLEIPWSVSLIGLPGIAEKYHAIEVHLPHPGFFIVQKILISEEPNRIEKRPKDMAYVYQVVSLFRRDLKLIASDVRARMEVNPARRRWLERFKRMAESLFAGPAATGVREAHIILEAEMAGSGLDVPSPNMIHAGIALFLEAF